MLRHSYQKYTLRFTRPSGTSRGILRTKDSWFIKVWDDGNPEIIGIGECSILEGLSPDDTSIIEEILEDWEWTTESLPQIPNRKLDAFPALHFALETALWDLHHGGRQLVFPSSFTEGNSDIKINGLIWMGDTSYMLKQIKEKIEKGFKCLKMKIGAMDFNSEADILKSIRSEFVESDLELRVDANGAFDDTDALEKLKLLSSYQIHSIEQPIKPGQIEKMSDLCRQSPLPIALDEELIGVQNEDKRNLLIDTIKPQFIILKPSLVGGFWHAQEWIDIAESNDVGWWITSALESNIGLSAIAQWTAKLDSEMYQGLGTGQLFENNIPSPLMLNGEKLRYDSDREWDLSLLHM